MTGRDWAIGVLLLTLMLVGGVGPSTVSAQDPSSGMGRSTGWSSGFAPAGPNSYVTAVAPDDDAVYVAGGFSAAGGTKAERIARWDRETGGWSAPAAGAELSESSFHSLAAAPGDTLYAAGEIVLSSDAEGVPVAMWDGTVWSDVSAGIGSDGASYRYVFDLAFHDDTLYAGALWHAEQDTFRGVVRWDGAEWHRATESLSGSGGTFRIDPEGAFFFGGRVFTGTGAVRGVARWDGERWSYLESAMVNSGYLEPEVESMAVHGDTLYVAGLFDEIGGVAATRAALWDGDSWSALGDGLPGQFFIKITVDQRGWVYAGGGGYDAVQVWDGEEWRMTGPRSPFDVVYSLVADGNEIFVGGESGPPIGGSFAPFHLQWFDGDRWRLPGNAQTQGIAGEVHALVHDDQYVYAGGQFHFAGTERVDFVARWDGQSWTSLGGGIDGVVRALARGPDGAIYAAGGFKTAGEDSVNHIARWDGQSWSALGHGLNGIADALAIQGSDLYAAGAFSEAYNADGSPVNAQFVARWDGGEWHAVGEQPSDYPLNAIAVTRDDEVYAAGLFDAGEISSVVKWDGESWEPLGSLEWSVFALAVLGGELYVGGDFRESLGAPGNGVVRWDGTQWRPLGEGLTGPANEVRDLFVSETGDLYVAGRFDFAGGEPASRIARWDGSEWHSLDGGVFGSSAGAITVTKNYVFVGGRFVEAGGLPPADRIPSANIASWSIPPDLGNGGLRRISDQRTLWGNYPNPFSDQTTIVYEMSGAAHVRLTVYDVLGREIATLVDGQQPPGRHRVRFDAKGLASGTFFYRMRVGGEFVTRRMLRVR